MTLALANWCSSIRWTPKDRRQLFSSEVDDGQGAEVFYNFAITPAARFTTSAQWIKAVSPTVDNTTLLSARLQVTF